MFRIKDEPFSYNNIIQLIFLPELKPINIEALFEAEKEVLGLFQMLKL